MHRYIVLAWAVAASAAAVIPAAAEGFQVIVHESSTARDVTKAQLSAVFLKKTTRWPNGAPAVPVDQPDSSPARTAFSKDVLGKSVSAVASYWQQQIFSGREVPPAQKANDAAVLEFVKANPGAVGYVSGGAAPAGVKVLTVVER
jgi:ABC-type phosphate transport system substrate-binding protein